MNAPTHLLWTRRWFRVLIWTLITIVTLWVLLAVILSWTGNRRWSRLKAELDAHGETLDFLKLQPSPIPDEQNFAVIEPLNGIRLASGPSRAAQTAEAKREVITKACKFLSVRIVNDAITGDIFGSARSPKMVEIISSLRTQKQLPLSDQVDAKALRQSLEQHLPLLAQLIEAARTHPHSEFLPRLDAASLPAVLSDLAIPHYTVALDLGRVLHLHGIACIESGDGTTAADDVLTILRLAEGCLNESLLIGHIAGTNLIQMAAELTWMLLQKRSVTDEQLQTMQTNYQRLEIARSLLQAMRSEMASGASLGEFVEHRGSYLRLTNTGSVPDSGIVARLQVSFLPSGFFTHAKATLVGIDWDYVVRPQRERGLLTAFAEYGQISRLLDRRRIFTRPDLYLSHLAVPAAEQIRMNSALTENTCRQAQLACALERHFLQHGSYPAELGALDVAILAGTSKTAFDETPMHYSTSADARYRLWHPGPDSHNDGGALISEKKQTKTRVTLRSIDYQGDWVWRYEPVKQ